MRIFLVLLCFCVSVLTQTAAHAGKQDELLDLRSRIQALQVELEQTHEDQSEVTDALKHSERSISNANRGLRNLEVRQRKLAQTLKQLADDTETTQVEIANQQKHLAELVREHYVQGGNDALKLMLNGQNPGEVARNMAYYSYIGRSRAALIQQHRASLLQLQALQNQTLEQNQSLLLIKQERVAQKIQNKEKSKSKIKKITITNIKEGKIKKVLNL